MRFALSVLAGLAAISACSNGAEKPGAASSAPAATTAALVRPDAKDRCVGFGVAHAAELMGVPAASVTQTQQDITPTTRGCQFVSGEKKISFSVTVEDSVDEAKRALEDARETYEMSVRAQEKATGTEVKEGAYSDILGVADEAIWSVTNGTILARQKNVTFQIMFPNDKRGQAAVVNKIADLIGK